MYPGILAENKDLSGEHIMSKRTRQYIGILAALAAYYLVHEGAHLLYALLTGVFRQIRLMGLGVQIDIYAEHLTNMQLPGNELIGGTMKHYKRTITMLLTAAVLLVSVFMTGCTSLTEPKNSTPSGTDAPAESDCFGVYVKLERDDVNSIALHGSSFTKVCENADGSLLKAGEWLFTGDDIVPLSRNDNCSVLFTISAHDADDMLLGEGTFLYMACFIGVTAILCGCDYLWLRKTGTAQFAAL